MASIVFRAPIELKKHSSLIYAEGVFGLQARKKLPMRAKTADGILRYAEYKISGVIDSTAESPLSFRRRGVGGEVVGDFLPTYLRDSTRRDVPIFKNLKEAKARTKADVLILGNAPEGGELPNEYTNDIAWAIKNKMHIVSGTHYFLTEDKKFSNLAKKYGVMLWDTRKAPDIKSIPVGSANAYHIKKPIVLTVGMDAAIGKMTVAYEMDKAAKKLGLKSCVIPTGQTAMIISGWGVAIDALPADFMTGAVEQMVLEKAKNHDILFVEGQGSLFHPAYANTTIALIHGAVPTHMILVVRPQRKHSIGSKLVKLPDIKRAIAQYESSILPFYRNSKVIAVAVNSEGLDEAERERYKKEVQHECGLPVFDALYDEKIIFSVVKKFAQS